MKTSIADKAPVGSVLRSKDSNRFPIYDGCDRLVIGRIDEEHIAVECACGRWEEITASYLVGNFDRIL